MIPVEGHRGLYRDEHSNAIINRNNQEYQEYLKMKNQSLTEREEIDNLKTELSEIKNLLKQLINNQS